MIKIKEVLKHCRAREGVAITDLDSVLCEARRQFAAVDSVDSFLEEEVSAGGEKHSDLHAACSRLLQWQGTGGGGAGGGSDGGYGARVVVEDNAPRSCLPNLGEVLSRLIS